MQAMVDIDRLHHRSFHLYGFNGGYYLLTGNSFLLGEQILNWAVVINKQKEAVELMYFRSYNHRVPEQTFLINIEKFLSSYPFDKLDKQGHIISLEREYIPGEKVPVSELVGQLLAQTK